MKSGDFSVLHASGQMVNVSHDCYQATETEQEFVIIQEFRGAILFNDC